MDCYWLIKHTNLRFEIKGFLVLSKSLNLCSWLCKMQVDTNTATTTTNTATTTTTATRDAVLIISGILPCWVCLAPLLTQYSKGLTIFQETSEMREAREKKTFWANHSRGLETSSDGTVNSFFRQIVHLRDISESGSEWQ